MWGYDSMKTAAIAAGWEDGPALHLGASVWGALVGTTIATPADVIMSRERTYILLLFLLLLLLLLRSFVA